MRAVAGMIVTLMFVVVPVTAQEAKTVVIAPGDMVRLTIYPEKDMTGPYPVPPDGIVAFPKIGDVKVTGMTPAAVKSQLIALYSKYLVNASIQVDLLHRVQIQGAVKVPNIYHLDETVTISDAIAIAGGVSPTGRMDRIELRRDGQLVEVLIANRTLADSPVRSGDQLYVPERSYISRNASTLTAVFTGVIGVIVAIVAK